jgi:hypothetical protein
VGSNGGWDPKLALTLKEFDTVEPLLQVALATIVRAVVDAGDTTNPLRQLEAARWLTVTGASWVEMLDGEPKWVLDCLERLGLEREGRDEQTATQAKGAID